MCDCISPPPFDPRPFQITAAKNEAREWAKTNNYTGILYIITQNEGYTHTHTPTGEAVDTILIN